MRPPCTFQQNKNKNISNTNDVFTDEPISRKYSCAISRLSSLKFIQVHFIHAKLELAIWGNDKTPEGILCTGRNERTESVGQSVTWQ
jgi:hypothetical protein